MGREGGRVGMQEGVRKGRKRGARREGVYVQYMNMSEIGKFLERNSSTFSILWCCTYMHPQAPAEQESED